MCTVIFRGKKPVLAESDFFVYKSLTEDLKGPYTDFQYKRNEKYVTEFTYLNNKDFITPSDGIEAEYYKGLINPIGVLEGFHSYRSIKNRYNWGVFVECIIPKGALYYENPCGNIVSNMIIMRRVIKSKIILRK